MHADTDPFATAVQIAHIAAEHGGRAFIVGGFVRDRLLHQLGRGSESKDLDLEVHGLSLEELKHLLQAHYNVDLVGASFGVLKLLGANVDVSVPRRDTKTRDGHRGFEVSVDAAIPIEEAARRRDFTINALLLDPLTNELLDPFDGAQDIEHGIVRAVDAAHFGEDPLRVLRAMQFAARFRMQLDPATADLCRGIDLTGLSKERIGEEWRKLLLRAERPSIGLHLGRELGVIQTLHPDLAALIGVQQRPDFHPEGDVWTHTCLAVDAAANIARQEKLNEHEAFELIVGTLCHDLGKATTTHYHAKKQRLVSYGHDAAGVLPAQRFLRSIHASAKVSRNVPKLVRNHMFPPRSQQASVGALRRLANQLQPTTIQQLCRLSLADQRGRGYVSPESVEQIAALVARARQLHILTGPVEPLLQGRDLLEQFPDLQAGPSLGALLDRLYQAQLDDVFTTKEAGLLLAETWLV
jgi:tRNA nucleotidyltransferase (CCA-adding enzyme)